jgi:L-amino acid N-acyltransferase YncA
VYGPCPDSASWAGQIPQGKGPNNSYNDNKIRFPAPVPVDARVRGRAEVISVDAIGGGWWQVVTRFTLEVEGNEKPRPSIFGHWANARAPRLVENAAMTGVEELVVRRAHRDDCGAMCGIYNAAIAERGSTFETEPRSADDFGHRVDDARFPFLVADAGGGVIGWAGLAPYSARPCYAGIGECSVYVAGEERGRGVGSALTEALAVAVEGKDFHKMIGKLFTDNAASVRLVERCGFSSVGLHRRHGRLDGTWRDVLVVERLLGPAT